MNIRACFALLALVMGVTPARAADPVAEGQKLLTENCSRCHAIGQQGDSPLPIAPPFRTVMKIYAADSLEEALAEGLITGHPDMPEFVFPPEQVGDIVAGQRGHTAILGARGARARPPPRAAG